MDRNIKRCISAGQGGGWLIVVVVVGHYNGGRHREALRQFDFVGRSSKLGTTEFLHETPGRVGGDDDVAVTGT